MSEFRKKLEAKLGLYLPDDARELVGAREALLLAAEHLRPPENSGHNQKSKLLMVIDELRLLAKELEHG